MDLATSALQPWRTRIQRAIVSTAIAAFFGALAIASFGSPTSAHADTHIIEYHNEDGSVIEVYQDDNGKYYAWGTEADGEQWSYTFDDNPNPDDPDSSTPMTPENVKEMIKKLGGEMSEPEETFWDNFLGRYLTGDGDGLIPKYNPSDIAQSYDDGAGGGGGNGIDGTGGDVTEQLKHSGGGSPDNGDDDERDDYGTESPKDGMYDDVMVGPPELINPNPMRVDEKAMDVQP